MLKLIRRLTTSGLVIYLGIVIVLMFLEATLMYPAPNKLDGDWSPEWLTFEDVVVDSKDGAQIHGWFCEHPNPLGVLLLFHGNGEHVAYMADEIAHLRHRLQMSVMAFDYRGYGKSTGRPYESGILADGEAIHSWLVERTGNSSDEIYLYGRSLGGAVAVHVAAEQGCKGLILDRTFSSMVDAAAHHYPWLPVRFVLRNRYPSDKRIEKFDGPLLQFHGEPDRVVPFEFGRRLFKACPSDDKTFIGSKTLEHNSAWPEEFYTHLDEFLLRSGTPEKTEPAAQ